ncbi:glutathione S-transferase GST protein [Rutstroemia sp. NJR-2017a WRK4]|nr:glutathione S-transferase GST protein [Rutstroemia sp. NJR-2017a WRK4]
MTKITFYWAPGACSLAPHILLHEIGIDFESVQNEVTKDKVAFASELATLNPKQRLPVLVLNGETITETPAIATAISLLAPERHFMGRTPMDRVRVYEWMNWLSGTLHAHAFGGLLRPHRFSNDPSAIPGIQAKGLENVKNCYGLIEKKLHGVHAVGNIFTVVDPYLFVFYRWGVLEGINMKKEYPAYTALVSHLVERPAVKAAMEAESITSLL